MTNDSIERQIERLDEGVAVIRTAVEKLSPQAFLGPLGGWSARDIVAHLIGWHRYTARGAQQLLEGQVPFYESDENEKDDYSVANARLINQYSSEDRAELLAELQQAAGEFGEFLRSISDEQWRGSTGVEVDGEAMTVRQNTEWLIEDHHHHRAQIEELAKTSA